MRDVKKHGALSWNRCWPLALVPKPDEVERCDRPSERGTEGEAAEYSRADQRKGKGSVGGSMAGVQVRAQMRLRGPTASVASVGARPHARGGRRRVRSGKLPDGKGPNIWFPDLRGM